MVSILAKALIRVSVSIRVGVKLALGLGVQLRLGLLFCMYYVSIKPNCTLLVHYHHITYRSVCINKVSNIKTHKHTCSLATALYIIIKLNKIISISNLNIKQVTLQFFKNIEFHFKSQSTIEFRTKNQLSHQ